MAEPSALIVTIHDVAPHTEPEVRWLLAELDTRGVSSRVLAVIPNDRGRGGPPRDGSLADLLRTEAGRGSEIVLHGWSHMTEGRLRGRLHDRLRAQLFAPSVAEFVSISEDEARRRVADGTQALRDLGLSARGFLAPGWLWQPELPTTLANLGLTHLVGFARVVDLRPMRSIRAPGFGYMGTGQTHERLAAFGGWLLRAAQRDGPVVQVYLHPQRAPSARRCRAVLDALAALMNSRAAMTYADLIDAPAVADA